MVHTPNAHSSAATWNVLEAFAFPQVEGAAVSWDIRGLHSMFRTPSAIQELLRRWVGQPVRLEMESSSLQRGVRATILSGEGDRLSNRLNDHRKNIGKAATLQLEDFEYRALVVQTGWQTAAEDYLIHLFKPIWNNEVKICYGFGKHGDDPGTRANLRSPWDTLHPGRVWAHRDPNMKDARSAKRIVEDIAATSSETSSARLDRSDPAALPR